MAKKIFLRDENNVKVLPITRGELILDSSGNPAFHSNEFLATDSQPGLMSPDDKQKLETVAGNTVDTELSNTSTNPVQNKVLTQIINSIREKYLKSAVVSGNKVTITDQSNNTVEFVNSTYQIVTNAVDGLVPKYDAVDGTIDAQTTDWVLTNHNGTLGWYKLPTAAFSSSSVQLFVGAKSTSNNNNSNSATTNGNTYLKLFDNSTLKNQYNIKGTGLATVISDDSGTITINVPTSHNQASSDINSLTGYTKATGIAAIATTDSLNSALGKLELKADTTYELIKGAYDGDGTIENLAEILKVLEGIKDTETIQAIIGKYLPLTGGTLSGNISAPAYLLGNGNGTYIDSGADNTLIFYDNTARRTVIHSGNINQQNVAGANKLISQYVGDLNGAEADRFFTSGFQASNRPSHHNYATGISLYNSELKYKYQLTFDTYGTLYTRYLNSSNTWSEWNQIAGIANIPTLISQLTDDLGLIHTGNIQNQTVLAAKQLAGLYVGDNADANSFYHTSESVIKFRTAIGNNSTNFPVFASWQNALLEIGLHSNGSTAQFYFSKDNPLYYRSNYTNAWQQIAYTSDIPTKLSQLTNDLGFVVGGPYLPTAGGTMLGEIQFNITGLSYSDISTGIKTAFKAPRVQANELITNYIYLGASSGAKSNLPLVIRKYDSVSSQAPASVTDLVTINTDGNIKATNLWSIVSITKSIKLTKDWQDTGIVINDITFPDGSGTYAVQVFINAGESIGFWYSLFSGVASFQTLYTNGTEPDDEILLHHSSHGCSKQIYLKTKPTSGGQGYYNKLYIACNSTCSTAVNVVFKFKKLI